QRAGLLAVVYAISYGGAAIPAVIADQLARRGRAPGRYRPRRTDLHGSARGTIGWEYVHVCVDDYSRLAYAEVLPDEKATTAIGFLPRAIAFYSRYGIQPRRLLTDNGSAYRSTIHAIACKTL